MDSLGPWDLSKYVWAVVLTTDEIKLHHQFSESDRWEKYIPRYFIYTDMKDYDRIIQTFKKRYVGLIRKKYPVEPTVFIIDSALGANVKSTRHELKPFKVDVLELSVDQVHIGPSTPEYLLRYFY